MKSLPQRKATNEELRRASSLSKLQPGKDTAALTDEAKVEALNRDYEQLREDLIKEGFFKPNLFHVVCYLFDCVVA